MAVTTEQAHKEILKEIARREKAKKKLPKADNQKHIRYEVVATYGGLYVRTYKTKFVKFESAKLFGDKILKSKNNVYTKVIIWGYDRMNRQDKVYSKDATKTKQMFADNKVDTGIMFTDSDRLAMGVIKSKPFNSTKEGRLQSKRLGR